MGDPGCIGELRRLSLPELVSCHENSQPLNRLRVRPIFSNFSPFVGKCRVYFVAFMLHGTGKVVPQQLRKILSEVDFCGPLSVWIQAWLQDQNGIGGTFGWGKGLFAHPCSFLTSQQLSIPLSMIVFWMGSRAWVWSALYYGGSLTSGPVPVRVLCGAHLITDLKSASGFYAFSTSSTEEQ